MDNLAPILRVQRILWFALTSSPLLYLGIARFAAPAPAHPPEPVILYALAAVAVPIVGASFALPAAIFARAVGARVGKEIRVRQVATPTQLEGGFRDAPPSAAEVEDPAAVLRLAARLDLTPLILTLALRESVAIFGLVLGFVGFPFEVTAGFCGLSVALMLARFPSLPALARRTESAVGARVPPP